MKTTIERPVTTCCKDETIMSMVVFPCNEEDLKERFQVSDLARELKFVDVPESKVSIPRFNGLVLDSPSRGAKLEEQINAAVRYLEERLLENPQWRGKSEEIPLNFADSMVWNWCTKDDYRHPNEKVKVWYYRGALTVFYGEQKEGGSGSSSRTKSSSRKK